MTKSRVLIAAFAITAYPAMAQIASITDGTTPPPIQPGAPEGSYALSGFETVNPYTGHLSFRLPLLKINGRGEAGYEMVLPIERNWRIENHPSNNQNVFVPMTSNVPTAPYWGSGFAVLMYLPGRVVVRRIVDTAQGTGTKCPLGTNDAGSTMYLGQTLTRLTYIEQDGTEHQLIDTATNGQPGTAWPHGNCTIPIDTLTNRGRTFVSTDGTSMTFIADADVYDANSTAELSKHATTAVDGWLQLSNGTKYRFEGAVTTQIQDRNGNVTTFCYPGSTGCYLAPGASFTVTDSLGRRTSVQYADFNTTFADTITYQGYQGAQRVITINYVTLGTNTPGQGTGLLPGQNIRTFSDLFPITSASSSGDFIPIVVSSVVLPDHTSYQLLYNSYGELARIVLPTGGAFEYDYPSTTPDCGSSPLYGCTAQVTVNSPTGGTRVGTVFRRVMQRRVLPNGSAVESKTNFTPTYGAAPQTTSVQVDVLDGAGNPVSRETHIYSGNASNLQPYPLETGTPSSAYPVWSDAKETETDSTALETGGNQKVVKTLYGPRVCNTAFCSDPNPCQSTTTLSENSSTITVGELRLYDQYSNLYERYEYDYGSAPSMGFSCPTAASQNTCQGFSGFKRCTHTEHLTGGYDQPNSSANLTQGIASINNHLRGLPTTNQIYDAGGSLASRTDYAYDGSSVQNDPGIVGQLSGYGTSFTTGRGNATSVLKYYSSAGANRFDTVFDVAGNPVQVDDGLGRATTLTYTTPDFGFVNQVCKNITETGAAHNRCFTQTFDYQRGSDTGGAYGYGSGQLATRTDFNGATTQLAYGDPLDRLLSAVRATGTGAQNQTAFQYSSLNTVITSLKDKDTFQDGVIATQTILDGLGRQIESRQFEDSNIEGTNFIAVKRIYDAMGRAFQVSNPARSFETPIYTTTVYDSLGRTHTVTAPAPDNAVTTYAYTNNSTTVTDPAAKARKTVTDALGRVTDVYEDPAGQNLHTSYTYNAADSLTNVHQAGATGDPALPDRTFTYDLLQRLTSASNPESGYTSYSLYDADNNLQTKVDANGTTTSMNYDEADRITSKSYTLGSSHPSDLTATATVSYTYGDPAVPNSAMRLTQTSNGSPWQIFGFDALGRVTSSAQTVNGVQYIFPSYIYNLADELKSITYPTLRVITTTYDAAGRPTAVNGQTAGGLQTSYVFNVSYAASGGVANMNLGVLTEQTCYNVRLQPTGIRYGPGTTTNCANSTGNADTLNLAYTYNTGGQNNNNGNVVSQAIMRAGTTWTQTYTYL